MSKYFRLFFIYLILSASATNLQAEIVSLQTSKDITATANYRSGDKDKPLLIFIHGFLQTRDFSTVKRLSDTLHESGYSVLSPTLSLGISNRAQSLPCESIHLHSLKTDTDEIDQWVNWGKRAGYREIVLIGHSAGSVNITAYLANGVDPAVNKTVLISLTYYGSGRPAAFETEEYAEQARKMLHDGDNGLGKFALAFCKEYVTTAEDYLSYYDWSSDKILDAIKRTWPENFIIIGSEDERIGQDWVSSLEKASGKIIVIDGASHFFDQTHEFDLADSVEEIIADD